MVSIRSHENYFPKQKVSSSERAKAEWYSNCIDFIIDRGLSCNDEKELENKINILHGDIPDEFYRKTLNPYNSANEKLTRFPATMRNLDIISDIVRRFVGEYTKSNHEFIVGSNDPDFVIKKNAKLQALVGKMCQEAFVKEFQRRLQQMMQEQQQQQQQQQQPQVDENGQPVEGGEQQQPQINPKDVMSQEEMDQFIKDFNENYIDEATQQGEKLLDYIRDNSKDEEVYSEAYFNFVTFGRCFTYHDVRNNTIFKQNVPVNEAFPIPTTDKYIEDSDMFARRIRMTRQQILDVFEDDLTTKDKDFFNTYYAFESGTRTPVMLGYNQYFETYPDVCEKFTQEERELFRRGNLTVADINGDLYDVWHVVWKGYAKVGILTYMNEMGMQDSQIVEDDFKFDESLGHIDIEWLYVPQIYEGYRIGSRYNAIYPIKARQVPTIDYKLPYNGLLEPIPLMGEFSIVKIIAPYQILRNIISYHREMVVAKNKLLILIMPESLIEDKYDDRVYRMAADGTLIYDDSVDSNSLKAQQIRLLNANLGDYIRQLTELIESIKLEAREMVDMTAQRYGQIATSAGKGTTEEAIARGSMGSATINFVFDKLRRADYQQDINLAKLAFIDGLTDGYFDGEGNHKYVTIDPDILTNSDLSVGVRNSAKETEKLEQLRQWAFSAAQNGDLDMALAAITGNSVNSMKLIINKFNEMKQQNEMAMKQADQMIEQEKIQAKLQEIAAKGEEDRKTEELKYYYEMQLKYIDADVSLLGDPDTSVQDKNASNERIEQGRRDIERMKLDIERQKLSLDAYNAAADRNVQREQMKNDLKIARTNKNRYDK